MAQKHINIRPAESSDADPIATIYNRFIRESVFTFEEEPISADEVERRMSEVSAASLPWVVVEQGGHVIGYAYAAPWKSRSAYRFSVETTIYLAEGHAGRGIGAALYSELFASLKSRGIHAVIGGIALPNAASVALHEKLGMSKVAHFEDVGFKFNRWIDVGYWELKF
jgi:phosphinothricin acetyltransferase